MIFKNDNIGLLCGTFFGAIIGSVGTILTFKKLGKLEEKKINEHEEEVINEIREFYEAKIERIVNDKPLDFGECTKTAEKSVNRSEEKAAEIVDKTKKRITFSNVDVKDTSKVEPQFDYSKISKEQFTDLKKEYEREEPDVEEEIYPVQITKEQFDDEIAYRKERLIYYEQNGIFAGYDDVPVNDVYDEKYFGFDNLSLFGSAQASLDGKSSTNELYLRDRLHNVDFQLVYNATEDFYKVIEPKD